jgi:hypothetical protein
VTEAIATVSLTRDEDGRYGVVLTFADGKLREVSSAQWRTLTSALDFAARLIAGELSRRAALSEVP